MKKPALTLFFILMLLLFIAPKLWAQNLVCEEANGLNWCYNPQACGQACNDVCAAGGMQPIADNNVWLEAQNTEEECQAISQALGLGDNVIINDNSLACVIDSLGIHSVGGGLNVPLQCTTEPACPGLHRTDMPNLGVPCGGGSRRSVCPCGELQAAANIPTLSEWGLIAMAGVLGIIALLAVRRRNAAA